jgi:adenylosuccinate lyase
MIHPLSPLDGRYAPKVAKISPIFSEFGLMQARVKVEILWLMALSEQELAPAMDESLKLGLLTVMENFSEEEFQKIKVIEATINHDVKAVEYFLRELVPENYWSFIHFACTSEDINNTAYALMVQTGIREILDILDQKLSPNLVEKSRVWKSTPMLARTHGQTATPTTMGKEWGIFWHRVHVIRDTLENLKITAKINGATGTYSAHKIAFPDFDWIAFSEEFITDKLGLDWTPLTAQIEPHDQQVAVLQELCRLSSVLIDLCRDVWGYISLGYFGQKTVVGEVGSSTMPHKVNPIDFENAEGNFKLGRGVARTLADELPVSRWQRDLTDSTLQRNLGLAFGYTYLGIQSLLKGLGKLEIREEKLSEDLEKSPEVLTEAVQTVMRAHGKFDAYEQLKEFSRGKALNLEGIRNFVMQTDLPEETKKSLLNLTPATYTGWAEKLVDKFVS